MSGTEIGIKVPWGIVEEVQEKYYPDVPVEFVSEGLYRFSGPADRTVPMVRHLGQISRARNRPVFYLPGTSKEGLEDFCADENIDVLVTGIGDGFYHLLGCPEMISELIAWVKRKNGGVASTYSSVTIARAALRPA